MADAQCLVRAPVVVVDGGWAGGVADINDAQAVVEIGDESCVAIGGKGDVPGIAPGVDGACQ